MTYPARAYVIRHGEETGDKNNPHLSTQGYLRAAALFDLFGPGGRLSTPQFLIAADRSKHSNRCVETLQTLGSWLHLDIDHHYDDDEYRDLAKRIKSKERYQGCTILVCWHHGNIPNLAKALGAAKSRDLPSRSWPDDVYDRVWTLDFNASGLLSIRSEPQGLAL